MVKGKEKAVQLLTKFNPDSQMQYCSNPDDCVNGEYLTLAQINRDYGANVPIAWLTPQLVNLASFCGAKDKLDKNQIKELAYMIAVTYYYLKVTELMLFFRWFKSGRYGNFYGAVDPITIMQAIGQFIRERNLIIERKEQADRAKEREKRSENAISWEEYCKRTGREVSMSPVEVLNSNDSMGYLARIKKVLKKQ